MTSQIELGEKTFAANGLIQVDATEEKNPRQALEAFIEHAPRGAKAVYCRGPFLESYSLGEFARKMHAQGRCYLVQRRIKVGRSAIFEYLIVKR